MTDFIAQSIIKFGEFLDYSKVNYVNNYTKVTLVCPKHGPFKQSPKAHLKARISCPKCSIQEKQRMLGLDFIAKAEDKFPSIDYSAVCYKNNSTNVLLSCPIHGNFYRAPAVHLKSAYRCPKCYKEEVFGTTEGFIKRARKAHNNLYDYSSTRYINNHIPVQIICSKHGEFFQAPNAHVNSLQGCPKCAFEVSAEEQRGTFEEFVAKSRKVHGDKYKYVDYVNNKDKVTIICPTHGPFKQSPVQHYISAHGCPRCSTTISKPHQQIIDFLRESDIEFTVNNRKELHGLELDIYIPSKSIGIEVNGLYYHSSLFKDKFYHSRKQKLAAKEGITLLQFWDWEIREKYDIVKSMLLSKLGLIDNVIFARKTQIVTPSSAEYRQFISLNHLQGPVNSSLRKGLMYDDTLVAVLGLSKHKEGYHIDRFSTLINRRVVGGFSKLLKHAEVTDKIISFSFNRYSAGDVYSNNGFKLEKENKVTLFFTDGVKLYSRNMFQKHKLPGDRDKTSLELCADLGVYPIFGAGTSKWVRKNV